MAHGWLAHGRPGTQIMAGQALTFEKGRRLGVFMWVLVPVSQDWRWSSLGRYTKGDDKARQLLAKWPITRPTNWTSRVNRAESQKELEAVRRSVNRGQSFGRERWCERIVQTLGLESTLRPRGRPRKPVLDPQ